eukprot:c34161_g1_i1 orf=46-204(+)
MGKRAPFHRVKCINLLLVVSNAKACCLKLYVMDFGDLKPEHQIISLKDKSHN